MARPKSPYAVVTPLRATGGAAGEATSTARPIMPGGVHNLQIPINLRTSRNANTHSNAFPAPVKHPGALSTVAALQTACLP